MTKQNNGLSLEKAIGHCESVDMFIKQGGSECSDYGDIARYLRRLKTYEDAIKRGDLVWKEERK